MEGAEREHEWAEKAVLGLAEKRYIGKAPGRLKVPGLQKRSLFERIISRQLENNKG